MGGSRTGGSRLRGSARRSSPTPDSDIQAVSSRLLTGFTRLLAGDPRAAAPLLEEALARAEALDDPRQVMWAAAGGIFVGDRARALRSFDRASSSPVSGPQWACSRMRSGCAPTWRCGTGASPTAAADGAEAARLAEDTGAENAGALPAASLAWLDGPARRRGPVPAPRGRCAGDRDRRAGSRFPPRRPPGPWRQLDLALGRWDQALVRLLALEEIRPGFGHPVVPS